MINLEQMYEIYNHFERIEESARNSKKQVDYLICHEKYGFGTGDTIHIAPWLIDLEIKECDDRLYQEALNGVTTAKVLHVSHNRGYISLELAGYRREYYTYTDINQIVEMQKRFLNG